MASYSYASSRAREEAMDQLNRDARKKYGYEYVVDYVSFPGAFDYRHTMTLDYSFNYEEEHTSNEHVADDVTYDVYSDGSKVETSRSAVYKDVTYVTVETAHDTAEYHFFVLRDPTYRNKLNSLANNSLVKAYQYDSSKGSDQNVKKAQTYLKVRTILDSYICGGFALIHLIFLLVFNSGNHDMKVKDFLTEWPFFFLILAIIVGIGHKVISKQEDAYRGLVKNVGGKLPFYFTAFQIWYFLILVLAYAFTKGFPFEGFMMGLQIIVGIINLVLPIVLYFKIRKGYSDIQGGLEVNKNMIKIKNSPAYRNYVSECENFCRNCLR